MKRKTIVIIVIILVVIAIAWYFAYYGPMKQIFAPQSQYGSGLNSGDTTADIGDDLSQLPDESAPIDEMNSLDNSLQEF